MYIMYLWTNHLISGGVGLGSCFKISYFFQKKPETRFLESYILKKNLNQSNTLNFKKLFYLRICAAKIVQNEEQAVSNYTENILYFDLGRKQTNFLKKNPISPPLTSTDPSLSLGMY